MAQIKVHEKVLGHLSRGLYRSPASAIRELVSNAWDADASYARVDTNFPNFFQVSVEDDGTGFTREDFKSLMEGGVGNSLKRTTQTTTLLGRPCIGRLGIGLLGIAQICGAFTVISKTASGEGFKARVHLYDLLRERMDNDEGITGEPALKEVPIGEYEFDKNYDLSRRDRGTTVVADDIHPTFSRVFKQSIDPEIFPKYKSPPRDWSNAVKLISKVHSLQEIGDYWRLIWELAASVPVPYLSPKALPEGAIRADQELLQSFGFRVLVDGIALAKPVLLARNKNGYTTTLIPKRTERVYGKNLTYHGYIVVQEGAQLLPDELRGILIRIRNVAVGYYDPTMLDYRFNEGPRSRWLTGEIFVEEGLEDALNIDRDSFNRFHPEYRTVQQHVHGVLRDDVFPRVYKKIGARTQRKSDRRAVKQQGLLQAVLSDAAGSPVKLKRGEAVRGEPPGATVTEAGSHLDVELVKADARGTKKKNQDLAAAVLSIFEIAMREKGRERQRAVFSDALRKLLAEW